MKQGKKVKKFKQEMAIPYEDAIPITLRIKKTSLASIKEIARAETRTIIGQINVAVSEWLEWKFEHGASSPLQSTRPIQNSKPMTPRQAQAVPPAVPQGALQNLVEDEEGWEGTAPAALGGTKVKM